MFKRIKTVARLKTPLRMKWLFKGMPKPESIAYHSYHCYLIIFLLLSILEGVIGRRLPRGQYMTWLRRSNEPSTSSSEIVS